MVKTDDMFQAVIKKSHIFSVETTEIISTNEKVIYRMPLKAGLVVGMQTDFFRSQVTWLLELIDRTILLIYVMDEEPEYIDTREAAE